MGVITLSKESHLNPGKFRIKYDDASKVLGPNPVIPVDDKLPTRNSSSKITIIGAGFGGIATSISCLKKLNTEDFTIFEKHANFGGTWWANTYPGAASDIPAVWYSLFDELTSNWTSVQPQQFEMEEYILRVVEKYRLRERARFQTTITSMKWNDAEQYWLLEGRDLTNGQLIVHKSDVVVNCIGGLVHPNQLTAPGLENFKGEYMHSAVWNHDVEIKGKNVVVVGNGCSANQVIPSLLRSYEPKSVTQIARSKHYIMPPVPAALQNLYKLLSGTWLGLVIVRFVVIFVAECRYPLFKGNGLLARLVRWITTKNSLSYMRKTTPKEYQKGLIPDFKIGCKRVIFDHSYLPSLHDKRMDFKADEIAQVKEHSIVLKSGDEIPADVLVACTGYNLSRSMHGIQVIGSNGFNLIKSWEDEGISAYKTILVKNCPNFFLIGGPNSATGHASVVMAIENGTVFFTKVIKPVIEGKDKSVTVKSEKYDEWREEAQEELKKCVFGTPFGGCVSWYADAKTNFTTYPYSQVHYWWVMNHPNFSDFNYISNDQFNKKK